MAKKTYELSDEEKEKAKELLNFMNKNKNNTDSKISMDLPTANMNKPKNEIPLYDKSSSIDLPTVKLASQQETKNFKKFRESNNFTDVIDNVTGVLGNIGMGIESVIPNMTKYMNEGNKIATKKVASTIIGGILNKVTKNKEFSDNAGQIIGNTLGEKAHNSLNPIAKANQELNNANINKWRTDTIQDNISKTNNFLTTKLAKLAPSIGNNALPMAVALTPIPGARALSTAMFMTSAGGSYLDDAIARGMQEDEAFGYATIMGTLEGGTEALISGSMLNKGVKLATGHELSKEILGSYGLNIAENFAQEAIMEPLSELTATITGGKESADWDNMWQRMLNSGIDGALSAVLLSGASAGIGSATNVVNKRNNGETVTQNEIKTAMEDIQNSGKIDIEEVIKGSIEGIKDNNTNVEQNSLSTVNTENTYSNQLKQMASKEITNSNISEDYKSMMLDVLNSMNEVSDADISSIRQNINSLENKNQTILNNQELSMQSYQYEKSDNAKINNLREDASKYFDNSKESHTYIDMLEKIITDKDIDIRLDGELKTPDGRVVNGSYANGTITINPNSNRAGEFIAIHELTHAIGTKEMLKIVENYRKSNAEFDTSVKQLLGNYNSTEITEEALADVSAQLFGNQEFINNVANTNPSFFRKIYNEIKYLWHQFRGYKNQNEFVEDLYNKWTWAYNSNSELKNTEKYHISENFSSEIDKALNNQLQSNSQVKARDYTPQILVDNGVDNLPMLITQKHIKSTIYTLQEAENLGLPTKNINYHGLGKDLLIKAIDNLDSPQAIYKTSENNYLVVTEFKDNNGKEIVIPIQINGNGRYNNVFIDENQIKSVYGRNNLDNYINKNNFEQIYKKNEELDFNERIQYSNVANSSIKDSIALQNEDVNTTTKYSMQESENNSRSFDISNNPDIRYSIQKESGSWQKYLEDNFKASGTRTHFKDILVQKASNANSYTKTQENKYDSQSKTSVAFQKFTSDEWVNTINNAVNKTRSSQNIQHSVEKNNIKEYNNLQLGETKNINTNDLSQLAKDGGHRTTEQIESLRESIRQNGIIEPIEIYRKNDGTFAIENGNHRLKIASELGIEQVPVKLVEGWENLGLVKDKTETNILNEGIDRSDTSNRISEANIENDEGSGTGRRSVYDINDKFKNGRTAEKNVGISEGTPNSNQQTSNIKNEGNNRKQGVDDSTSFNMSESSKAQDTYNELETGEWTKRKKGINPSEISSLSKEDSSTTPKINPKKYEKGNRQSNFYENVVEDSQFINKDFREEMSKDENIRYYKGITNEQTLQEAYKSLKDSGKEGTLSWFSKNEKNVKAEDVAKGWILLKQYQDAGDYQGAVEVAKKMRQMGTNAGQAVQAYNILSRLTPEGMFYYAQSELNEAYSKMVEGKSKQWIEANQDKFNLTQEETQIILDTMKEVASLEDGREKIIKLAQIQKLVSDKIPPTTGQSVKAWMRISMLLNPKTQLRNVMGNAVVLPVNATSDVFAGALDKLISKKTGVRTTGITKEGVKGYAKGFKKGVFESYDDFRKGINTRNVEGNRFEIGEGKSFKDKGIGKALNRVDNMLSFALDVGDRGFYEATYTNSINNQMILNNTTEITQDMIDIATNEALQRTWQDSNNYTQAVLSIRKILNKANIKGYGLGDVLIPFAKTPANLTKAIVDYSPVGLTKTLALDAKKFTNSLQNGQYTPQLQHDFVQNVGKGLAGTMLYALGYALARAGIATGEPDDDKDVKNFMKNSLGISSYSIKIGDRSFTYDWAQPVATPLAIMTNYVKYSKDNPDASVIDKAIKAMNIGTEQLLQQSFMESLNTVLNGNGTTLENLSQAVLELPARAVPTFCKQIADMVDGTQRSSFEYGQPIKSAINSVKAKIPGLSQTLPASVDTLGNDIQKYGGNNNLWNVMLNPANTNKGQLTKTGQEIYNVYMNTGDTTIFPRTAPYYINNKGEKITMSSEQRNKFQRVSGKYVEESLNSLLNNKDYKNLSNNEKASIINEIVSDSYSKAKYDVLGMDSKEYLKTREILKDVSTSTYYNYKIITKNLKKDNDKIDKLANSNYTDKEKTALYENYILSSEDEKYPIIKSTFTENGLNITKYLQYKTQEFTADKKDGKSITGSKKDKVFDYIDSIKGATYTQKLILYALEYKPSSSSDREIVENYVRNLPNKTAKEKLEIMSKFAGVTVYKNNSYTY